MKRFYPAGHIFVTVFLALSLMACTLIDHQDIQGNSDNSKILTSEIDQYRQSLHEDSASYLTYLGLAWSLLDNKQYAQAVSNFNQALYLNPDCIVAYMGLGLAYESIGNSQYAIEAYSEVVQYHPDWHLAYYHLGKLYQSRGDSQNALKMLHHLTTHDKSLADQLMDLIYGE